MGYEVEQTEIFEAWHLGLKNLRAKIAIHRRIERAAAGHLGDTKPVGEGVAEMRIHMGPGFRLYFTLRKRRLILLLCGGDKHTQAADIGRAKALAKEV